MYAEGLKKVTVISKMFPYAVISISGGDPRASQPQWTAVDRSGNTSPTWNFPVKFAVEESATRSNCLAVRFRIRCKRTLGDKDIGEVHVPLSELFGPTKGAELLHSVTRQVRRPAGKPNKGELNFSYKWGEKMASAPAMEVYISQEPVTAYPAPPTGYVYPPPPNYGYPPVQPQKNNWLAKFLCVEWAKLCLGDAQDYKKTARQIRRKMMYRKMKTKLDVIGILLVLALIIWLSVCRGFHCTK
ncbi:hypothetical protein RHGRI_003267 [Rhododendron griersonianum]|uniref:C2 domain-containing protein n=1 Tax=Rhododendron griersonianum TaxID=479676 RepID=A0AAV6L4K8_9ERIC|nr:hypothetical protein RHGRI_003267 [Rhododendron griersonianum]